MPETLAYVNGQFVPSERAVVRVTDGGFVQGVTVSEQLRTFAGRLFRADHHFRRLARSLEIVGVTPPVPLAEAAQAAQELVRHNHALLDDGDDLGLTLFVTPGDYPAYDPHRRSGAMLCLHTFPLPFGLWVDKYRQGQALVLSQVRQPPPSCWPVELKCRSRMHYYLADREAHAREPGARALLLDQDGCVSEASTANLVVYRREEGLVSPPLDRILPGISLATVAELARELQIPFQYRELSVRDVAQADEVLLTSTSPCLLPVSRLDGRTIGEGAATMFHRLLSAWSRLAGLDILAQAERFARRRAD